MKKSVKRKRDESILTPPCGRSVAQKKRNIGFSINASYKYMKLYSAYLGRIVVPVIDMGDGTVLLEHTVPSATGGPGILVKCIDAQEHRLDVERYQYNQEYLKLVTATRISISDNLTIGQQLHKLRKGRKTAAIVKLNAIDIHFQTIEYVKFLQETVGINGINNQNALISIHNAPRLDNAFFTSTYMVYGNGDTMFTSLGSIDITGHELGHGVVETYSGLKYQGHSGALNESFSDVLGAAFEFWIYKKFNENASTLDDIDGAPDWLLGEDVSITSPYLRNMKDPALGNQPSVFQGDKWVDPNGPHDHGGVHINSGVTNYCYYLLSNRIGVFPTLSLYFQILDRLTPDSSFLDFRDVAKETCSPTQLPHVVECLNTVGLTNTATSKWVPQP
jgi:Zn-dependent metalloprotease